MSDPRSTSTRRQLSRYALRMAWIGWLGLIVSVCAWFLWLAPSQLFGYWLALFMIAPLILPVRGLLKGKPYTYASVSLLSLFYMLFSITELYANPAVRPQAYGVLISAVLLFVGSVMYVKLDARERQSSR